MKISQIKNKTKINSNVQPICNRTEKATNLSLQKVDPELHDRVINFPIHLRGDLMEKYNDATLRYTVKKTLAIYLPKAGKERSR